MWRTSHYTPTSSEKLESESQRTSEICIRSYHSQAQWSPNGYNDIQIPAAKPQGPTESVPACLSPDLLAPATWVPLQPLPQAKSWTTHKSLQMLFYLSGRLFHCSMIYVPHSTHHYLKIDDLFVFWLIVCQFALLNQEAHEDKGPDCVTQCCVPNTTHELQQAEASRSLPTAPWVSGVCDNWMQWSGLGGKTDNWMDTWAFFHKGWTMIHSELMLKREDRPYPFAVTTS